MPFRAIWVAVGLGSNTIAWSKNGINWTGLGNSIFTKEGTKLSWNGKMWIATGSGTNTLAYSYDGLIWYGLGKTIFTERANSIYWNHLCDGLNITAHKICDSLASEYPF